MNRIKVGILGATGMVGQRFVQLLENHPWFEVVCVAASPKSAGQPYEDVFNKKDDNKKDDSKRDWYLDTPIPEAVRGMVVKRVEEDLEEICSQVRLVFSAIDLDDKDAIKRIEEAYAAHGVAVVSNTSAHRWTPDVPMIMPEVNPDHIKLIGYQRRNRGWVTGLIAVKPNCSLQSYVPVIKALEQYKPKTVEVTTLQAISGAGKTFSSWPDMQDNVIPYIGGEEEKSEQEPMRILGKVRKGVIVNASKPSISATCIRVPVTDGHMASVAITFGKNPARDEFLHALADYNPFSSLQLPSAPKQFVTYLPQDDRPQTRLDRDHEHGMGITVGRLRQLPLGGWKFVCLSHNTIRGAAGGAILTAELLYKKGYIK